MKLHIIAVLVVFTVLTCGAYPSEGYICSDNSMQPVITRASTGDTAYARTAAYAENAPAVNQAAVTTANNLINNRVNNRGAMTTDITPLVGPTLATIDNGRIHAEIGNNEYGGGPGVIHLWNRQAYPDSAPDQPHDVMWFGQIEYIQVDGIWGGMEAGGDGTASKLNKSRNHP